MYVSKKLHSRLLYWNLVTGVFFLVFEIQAGSKNYDSKNSIFAHDRHKLDLFFGRDIEKSIGCNTLVTYYNGHCLEFLNNAIESNKTSFLELIVDATGSVRAGNKHQASFLALEGTLRCVGIVGNSAYFQGSKNFVKVGEGLIITNYRPEFARFYPWLKTFFIEGGSTDYCVVRIGLFEYAIGKGITFGNGYNVAEPLPGLFDSEHIDSYPMGFLVKIFLPKHINFQTYVRLLQINNRWSVTEKLYHHQLLDVTQFCYKPQTSLAVATVFTWDVLHNDDDSQRGAGNFGAHNSSNNRNALCDKSCAGDIQDTNTSSKQLSVSPYALCAFHTQNYVDYPYDALSHIYTVGLCIKASHDISHDTISWSFECAQNRGSQEVFAWDRNMVLAAAVPHNTHYFYVNPSVTSPYPTLSTYTEEQLTYVTDMALNDSSRTYGNGVSWYVPTGGTPANLIYQNSYDRFRKAYTNSYRGWFVYADCSYVKNRSKLGFMGGILSGDEPSNDSLDYINSTRLTPGMSYKDYDKNQCGFIGVNQMLCDTPVTARFIYETRKLCTSENYFNPSMATLTKPELSNLCFFGVGIKHQFCAWLRCECNSIGYMQEQKTLKGISMTYADIRTITFSEKTRVDMNKLTPRYIGTEINAKIEWFYESRSRGYLSGSAFFQLALLIPGAYYDVAQGKYLPEVVQDELAECIICGIYRDYDFTDFRVGENTGVLASLGVNLSF